MLYVCWIILEIDLTYPHTWHILTLVISLHLTYPNTWKILTPDISSLLTYPQLNISSDKTNPQRRHAISELLKRKNNTVWINKITERYVSFPSTANKPKYIDTHRISTPPPGIILSGWRKTECLANVYIKHAVVNDTMRFRIQSLWQKYQPLKQDTNNDI